MEKYRDPQMCFCCKFCPKSARKRIVPPIECELSFSTGTFLNNYDVIGRELKMLATCSTVGKREKWEDNTLVETTHKRATKDKDTKTKTERKGTKKSFRFYAILRQYFPHSLHVLTTHQHCFNLSAAKWFRFLQKITKNQTPSEVHVRKHIIFN